MEIDRDDDGVPSWVDVRVPDLGKAREFSAALFMGPQDIEPGRMAVLADNQGVMFNTLALKA